MWYVWSIRDRRGITDTWPLHVMVQSERMSWCIYNQETPPPNFCGCFVVAVSCTLTVVRRIL